MNACSWFDGYSLKSQVLPCVNTINVKRKMHIDKIQFGSPAGLCRNNIVHKFFK